MNAFEMIHEERMRQILVEGYTSEKDAGYTTGELSFAALAYRINEPAFWPFRLETFKPTTKIRNLVKSGALLLAEIDRITELQKLNPESYYFLNFKKSKVVIRLLNLYTLIDRILLNSEN